MFKVIEFIIEVIGWFRIVAGPFFLGLVIGAIVYFPDPTTIKLITGIGIAILGLCIGIYWAIKAWKNGGTIKLLSRISATPELDNLEEDSEENNTPENINKIKK